jgi:hypothetical protein
VNLQKQAVDISFAQGLDTKTDPWRVAIGKFLSLANMIFTTGMRLTKRNGYGQLTTLPQLATFLTTFNGNLTAVGSSLQALSDNTNQWYNKGTLQPVELEVLPLIRSNTNQSQLDTAISNGLVCTVYTDQTPTSLSTPRYLYVVADAVTGQNIIEPTLIPPSTGVVTGSPRVFVLGNYFIIVFTNVISEVSHLQYIAVSIQNPTIVTTNTDISSNYNSSPGLSWDGIVVGNNLYIAYDTTSGGQSIQIKYLTSTLVLSSATTYSTSGKVTATLMSVTADVSNPSIPIIWVSYYNSATSTGYAFAVNATLGKVLATPAEIITTGTILNLATVSTGGILTVYYEVSNNYGYDSSIPSHYVSSVTCTQSGTVGTPSVLVRSVGLASKAVLVDGQTYFLTAYQSELQSTYFLINGSGEVVSRIAYANGGGYCTVGLPSISVTTNVIQIGYLFKDFITSANTSQTVSITKSGIYSQTGLNLVTFTIGTSAVVPVEIAQTLNLSGGFLWEYDGYIPVEQNFFLWPDNVEGTPANSGGAMVPQEYQYQVVYTWTNNQGNVEFSAPSVPTIVDMSTNNAAFTQPTPITTTGIFTAGQSTIVVSSATGLSVGQIITDTTTPASIQVGTYITKIVSNVLTISQPLVGSSSSDTVSVSSICKVTLNIPTLRLTYKLLNPVKLEIFRWSTSQEEFFQVTSIELPLINNTAVDYLTYVDTQADNQISGNSLIYTTGGVVEDVGAPSFNAMTLFDDRLWGINAEDPNSLWYSKQVIESTPVEMSDLFTFYVAPSTGVSGSTGNLKCIFPMDDKLILFKEDALLYINGTGPDNTGSNSQYSQPIFITSVVGSSNQQSIVFMPDGLMFQSDKGIWLLGRGMNVEYIGAPVESYTKTAIVQSAVSVPGTTQVRFTLDSGITLMYDYFYQQWGTFVGVPAISSTLFQDLHTFVNDIGQVYQETPGIYLDGSNPVLMQFTTSWISLAGLQGYQRAYFFYLLGQYISPHFLQLSIAYDYNLNPEQSTTITPNNYSAPYGGIGPYGQQTPYGGPGDKEQWRIFLNKQRCQSMQLSLQEVFDASLGVSAGQGLTISGLNMIIGIARGFRSIGSSTSVGANTTSTGNQ